MSNMKKTLCKAEGGTQVPSQGQDQMQQLVAKVQEMLKTSPPEQVVAQLLQMVGDPQQVAQIISTATQQPVDSIIPMIQQVAEQMQSQPPQGVQPPAEASAQAPTVMAFGGTHMMPDGTMMVNSDMNATPNDGNPFKNLFGRYGEADWNDLSLHPNASTDLSGRASISRGPKEARQLARSINERIRDGVVSENGMDYGQFAKVHGRDFIVKGEDLGSFADGGEFDAIRKEMLKKFGAGGENKTPFDTTSTNAYVSGLKDALTSHMYKGFAVNKINSHFAEVKDMLANDGIPKAGNGTETPQHYFPGYGPGNASDPYGYQREKFGMGPLARLLGSVDRQRGGLEYKGFGELSGMDAEELAKALRENRNPINVEPIYKENIFGKEKRHTERNQIGERFTLQPSDFSTPVGTDANGNTITPNLEASPGNMAYDANGNGIPDSLQESTGTSSWVPSANLNNAIGDINNKGQLVPIFPFDSRETNRWDRKQTRENATPNSVNKTNAGPLVGARGYGQEANTATGLSLDKQEALFNELKGELGLPDSFDPWNLPDTDPMKQKFLDMYDERYQYACGGKTHKMMKAENGMVVQQGKDSFSINPSEFAYGLEGVGNQFNSFLDKLNAFQSAEKNAANRSPDMMFNPKAPHSGDEGIYWANLQRQMGQDMGADVLAGTGTDWAGFTGNNGRNIKGDFFTQQGAMANGGVAGMNEGDDLMLNSDQMKKLESIGYILKRKY
jgi:hypothetical protein